MLGSWTAKQQDELEKRMFAASPALVELYK
jgi:hypothetical protein